MTSESLDVSPARMGLLEAGADADFDKLTALAAQLLGAPISLVSIVEAEQNRLLFKSTADDAKLLGGTIVAELHGSYCKIVQETRAPLVVSNAASDERVNGIVDNGFLAYLGVPIHGADGAAVGAFCVVEPAPRQWTDDDVANVRRFAAAVDDQIRLRAALIDRSETVARLEREIEARRRAEARLKKLATTDALTGLMNRRALLERAEAERVRAARNGHTFGLAICDLDHFKQVNDRHGHDTGDAVLQEVALRLGGTVRDRIDIVARLGGEEFCLLFPDSGPDAAEQAAERVREAIARAPFVGDLPLTASLGVTVSSPTDDVLQDLLKRADEALYAAKGAGRDRVCSRWVSEDTSPAGARAPAHARGD